MPTKVRLSLACRDYRDVRSAGAIVSSTSSRGPSRR